MLTIALSKGRILQQTLPVLKKAGLEISDDELNSRKLILNTNIKSIKVIIIRATDVAVFVEHGAADMGIAGKDVLLEHGANNLLEVLDLSIAKCNLMLAAKSEKLLEKNLLKVATKYSRSTREYFANTGRDCEIIKLYGAMELAPIVGLADCIVDLVDTGNTLKANGLIPLEQIHNISSRLIVNSAAFKVKNQEIKSWIDSIKGSL